MLKFQFGDNVMRLKIVTHNPINLLGNYKAVEIWDDLNNTDAYINDQKVPPGLKRIILRGLECLTSEEYKEYVLNSNISYSR